MFGFLRQRIYLQLLIALALGAALGCRWPLPRQILTEPTALALVLLLGCLFALWWIWRWTDAAWLFLPLLLALCLLGFLDASLHIGLTLSQPLRACATRDMQELTGRVVSMPKYANGHLRFLMRVERAELAQGQPSDGLCYVYIASNSAALPPSRKGARGKQVAAAEGSSSESSTTEALEPAGSPLCYGERISLLGGLEEIEPPANRGQFDYRSYLLQRGTVLAVYVRKADWVFRLDEHPPALWAALTALRGKLTGALASGLPPELGDLAVSVVYGDKITDLPDSVRERFRRAGLTHILVASGTQVSLLIVLLAMLFIRFSTSFSRRGVLLNLAQFVLTLAIVLVYAAVTGFETSIVRAFVMGGMVLLARLASREADGMTTLAQSGLILLLVNPLQLLGPGTQLSFGATFGLIYAAGVCFPLLTSLCPWLRHVGQALVTTGGAQLFVAPLLITQFQQLSLWGLLSNLIAIPLSLLLLICGGLASLGLQLVPLLGPALRYCVWGLSWALNEVAALFARLPGANLAVPHPPLWWLVAAYALIIIAGEWIKQRGKVSNAAWPAVRWAFAGALALCFAGTLWWWIVPQPELVALALPRGEAYLWRAGSGRSVLLARGAGLSRSHNAETVASALRWRGVNRLHVIVWLDGGSASGGTGLRAGQTSAAGTEFRPTDKNFIPAPSPAELLPDTPAPVCLAGESLPPLVDMAWLSDDAGAYGARCSLGGQEAWIIWDCPADAGQLYTAMNDAAPALLVMQLATWQALPTQAQEALAGLPRTRVVTLEAYGKLPDEPQVQAGATELDARPARRSVIPLAYVPSGP